MCFGVFFFFLSVCFFFFLWGVGFGFGGFLVWFCCCLFNAFGRI